MTVAPLSASRRGGRVMETIRWMIWRGIEQLRDRASGPLNFRFVLMPTFVTLLAIRAAVRDARKGEPPFLWAVLTNRSERRRLLRTAVRDLGRVFLMAIAIDALYQWAMLHAFYPVQSLIVAFACAIVPYVLVRGPLTRLLRWRRRRHVRQSGV
jgi:hypothetical protein